MSHEKGEPIRCRAQVSDDCYNGTPEYQVYPKDGPGQSEDGTFVGDPHGHEGTVVCDPCYIKLGTPTLAEIPSRIAAARKAGGRRTA